MGTPKLKHFDYPHPLLNETAALTIHLNRIRTHPGTLVEVGLMAIYNRSEGRLMMIVLDEHTNKKRCWEAHHNTYSKTSSWKAVDGSKDWIEWKRFRWLEK